MSGTVTRGGTFDLPVLTGLGGEQRFKPNKDSGMPGPGGSGMPMPGMAEVAARKPTGRAGVFGSTTKRFHTLEDDAKDAPAPGSYETKAVPGVRRRAALVKPSSTFRSGYTRAITHLTTTRPRRLAPNDTANFMAMGLPKNQVLCTAAGRAGCKRRSRRRRVLAHTTSPSARLRRQAGLKQNLAAKHKGVMGTSGARRFASGVNEKHRYVPGRGV